MIMITWMLTRPRILQLIVPKISIRMANVIVITIISMNMTVNMWLRMHDYHCEIVTKITPMFMIIARIARLRLYGNDNNWSQDHEKDFDCCFSNKVNYGYEPSASVLRTTVEAVIKLTFILKMMSVVFLFWWRSRDYHHDDITWCDHNPIALCYWNPDQNRNYGWDLSPSRGNIQGFRVLEMMDRRVPSNSAETTKADGSEIEL